MQRWGQLCSELKSELRWKFRVNTSISAPIVYFHVLSPVHCLTKDKLRFVIGEYGYCHNLRPLLKVADKTDHCAVCGKLRTKHHIDTTKILTQSFEMFSLVQGYSSFINCECEGAVMFCQICFKGLRQFPWELCT